MINKISFGSTYKVTTSYNDKSRFKKFEKFAIQHCKGNDASLNMYDYQSQENPLNFIENIVLAVPDAMDNQIELFCKHKGVYYQKYQGTLNNND